jgi:hypothetical protein
MPADDASDPECKAVMITSSRCQFVSSLHPLLTDVSGGWKESPSGCCEEEREKRSLTNRNLTVKKVRSLFDIMEDSTELFL